MEKWYADNSELNGIWDAEIPDILLFGGVIGDQEALAGLQHALAEVKSEYTDEIRFPLKWNLRDLQTRFQSVGEGNLYRRLLEDASTWRREFFGLVRDVDFTVIAAAVLGYGKDRKTLKQTREALTRFAFSNALMRVGLHARESDSTGFEVVLDWPEGNNSQLYADEYRSAFELGKTSTDGISYNCGSLSELGFADSVFFSTGRECHLLQVADLVVGCLREFVEVALQKRNPGDGCQCLSLIRDRIRGAPRHVVGWGLSVAPTQGPLAEALESAFSDLYN